MWQQISGFSDYLINEHGEIVRISTRTTLNDAAIVSMKSDSGRWCNRSRSKLLQTALGISKTSVVAESIKGGRVYTFSSIKEAAEWLMRTQQAITAGRLAAYQTVRTNIMHGITQPKLYPFVYGYSWKTI